MENPVEKIKNPLFVKIGLILILIVMLNIPILQIDNLITQRQSNNVTVQNEISASWGDRQIVSGPILSIPYAAKTVYSDESTSVKKAFLNVFPKKNNLKNQADSEIRKRGIFEALLYSNQLEMSGAFDLSQVSELSNEDYVFDYDNAVFTLGLSDINSLEEISHSSVNGQETNFEQGFNEKICGEKGTFTKVKLEEGVHSVPFALGIIFKGNSQLLFGPSGDETNIELSSDWSSPSFTGSTLPKKRDITKEGFTARWSLNKYNRSMKSYTLNSASLYLEKDLVGVKLIKPVNNYSKNERSTKYSILIISLTFLLYIMSELMYKKKFHLVQYGLVGLALCLFYLMLLSISEHLGFNKAYVMSAIAITLLIGWYSLMALKNIKSASVVALALGFLYTYLFTILQLEDFALLAGALGLFVILALVMYMTRKVDWHDPFVKLNA